LVTSEAPLYFHVDGEIMCESANRIETHMLPLALRVITASVAGPA